MEHRCLQRVIYHVFKMLHPLQNVHGDTWNGVREDYRLENVIWNCQKDTSGICGFILLCQKIILCCLLWLVSEGWLFAIRWTSHNAEFLQIYTSVDQFFCSPFEVVAYKSSCQYLCRKNGKPYFGMMSGFDIWCGLTCNVVNVFLVVTICPLVLSGSDGRHSTENFDILIQLAFVYTDSHSW